MESCVIEEFEVIRL